MNGTDNIFAELPIPESTVSSQAKQELQEQHIPQTPQEIDDFIINNEWIVRTAVRSYRGLLEYEDLFQEACIGVLKGVNTYNPNKGTKLTTYVYTCAVNEIKMAIRKRNAKKRSATVIPIDFSFPDLAEENSKPLAIPDPKADVEKDALENVMYHRIMEIVMTKLTTIEQIVVVQYKDGFLKPRLASICISLKVKSQKYLIRHFIK